MPFPDLDGLPAWAQIFAYLVLAVCLGGGTALARLGFLRGQKPRPATEQSGKAEVAAVAFDSAAVERLAGEAAGLSVAITESNAIARDAVKASVAAAEQTERFREDLRDLGNQVRDLATIIARHK